MKFAEHVSFCAVCGGAIAQGEQIEKHLTGRWVHIDCLTTGTKAYRTRETNGTDHWSPKTLREVLSQQQTFAPDVVTSQQIGNLITLLDLHRPLDIHGNHGRMHTPTCGCEV